MNDQSTCLSCGTPVTPGAPFGLCSQCVTRSLVFSGWKDETKLAFTPEQNQEILQEGVFVGGGQRFKLLVQLGRGGMGVVWLAEDHRLRSGDAYTLVALKFLAPEIRFNPNALSMMQDEVLQSRRLRHRNIISLYDWHSDDQDLPFISMEYVDGETLTQIRAQLPSQVMTWGQIRPIITQTCEALDYAHTAEGIIHRDLKPGNLMLDRKGLLKLADFGLARPVTPGPGEAADRGRSAGTLAFMSPQQLMGRPPQASDDIYSLGATLYELLTGTPPFFQGNIAEQLLNSRPQPIPERLGLLGVENQAPTKLLAIINQCLDKNPRNRPGSARDVLNALPQAAATVSPLYPTRPAAGFEEEPEPERTSGGLWAALLLILLAAAGIGAWVYLKPPALVPQDDSTKSQTTNDPIVQTNRFSGEESSGEGARQAETNEMSEVVARPGRVVLSAELDKRDAPLSYTILKAGTQEVVRRSATFSGLPTTEDLPAGDYSIEMTCVDKSREQSDSIQTERVRIEPGSSANVAFSFRAREIRFQTQPPGATVAFNNYGRAVADTVVPNRPYLVIPGWRQFRFDLNGHLPLMTNLMIPGLRAAAPREPFIVSVRLAPQMQPVPGQDWNASTISHLQFRVKWVDPFWASAYEITRAQFGAFVKTSGHRMAAGMICVTTNGWELRPDRSWENPGFTQTEEHPVVGVSWEDAKAFCDWLTQQDQASEAIKRSQRYRLPTDMEFTAMTGGVEAGVGKGNYAGTEVIGPGWHPNWDTLRTFSQGPHQDPYSRTAPTGSTPAWRTPGAIQDLGGNVAEWCEDWYSASLNAPEILQRILNLADDGGGRTYRIVRGGSWFDDQPDDVLLTTRARFKPDERNDRVGFRVVLVDSQLERRTAPR